MKILQIVSGREINGALVYCRLLSEQLARLGHEVTLLCRPDSWMTRQGLSLRVLESEMRRLPTTDLTQISRFIRDEQIDVVHTHMSRAHTFGVLLKWLTGVPLVATAHNRYVQLHWRFNDRVIANSKATEEFHRRRNWVPAERIQTIHCFVDLERFQSVTSADRKWVRNELRFNHGEFVVGVIGEVIFRKGQKYLAQALPELVRRIPELQVILIGRYHRSEKYVQQMRGIQIRNGLYRRIRWLGRRANVQQYLAAMDLVLVPSTEEPFGLVAVEAQLAGTPVVAAQIGGLPEIVQHERNGLLIPAKDPGAITTAVDRLYANPDLRQRLVAQGRLDAATRFAPAQLTEKVLDVYRQVISARDSKRDARRVA